MTTKTKTTNRPALALVDVKRSASLSAIETAVGKPIAVPKLPVPSPSHKADMRAAADKAAATSPITKCPAGMTAAQIAKADPKLAALSAGYPALPATLDARKRDTSPAAKAADDKARNAMTAAAKAKQDSASAADKTASAKLRAELEASVKAEKAKKAAGGKESSGKTARKTVGDRKRYDWGGAEEAANKGKLPVPPDFSADTHARFRPVLAEVAKMVKAGDLEGLKKFKIKASSTSPRAIDRFRKIAIKAMVALKTGTTSAAAPAKSSSPAHKK